MSHELRQGLSSINFPDTQVYSVQSNALLMKPGIALEYQRRVTNMNPVSCIFASPDGIFKSDLHPQVQRGGGVWFIPVFGGVDITDSSSNQLLDDIENKIVTAA